MAPVNGNRKPHICGNRKLHTPREDVSGGADILPVMPVGRFGLDAGSGATGVLANTRREAAERRCCMKPLAGEVVWPALLLTLCSQWLQPPGGAR